jgi:hypothetical protein
MRLMGLKLPRSVIEPDIGSAFGATRTARPRHPTSWNRLITDSAEALDRDEFPLYEFLLSLAFKFSR